jgi:hypothetical protein
VWHVFPYQDSGFPCFKGGLRTIQNLRKRFHLSLTEEVSWQIFLCSHCFQTANYSYWWLQQCVSLVLTLISSSMDAWRTRQYDYYQRVLNGILWCSLQEWTYPESNFHVSIDKPWDCTGQFGVDLGWHAVLIPRVNKVFSTVVPCGISFTGDYAWHLTEQCLHVVLGCDSPYWQLRSV